MGACWGRLCGGAAILGAMPRATERPSAFAARAQRSARPPERVAAGPLVLRKMRPEDAAVVATVVGESLDHLRPWMPWANKDAADARNQLARIIEADELWESGSDYIYAIFVAGERGRGGAAGGPGDGAGAVDEGEGPLVGTIGLHRRAGEGSIEIGYWIAAAATRRGYGTAAARAVTSVAAALPGVTQVEIHCDDANVASAGIPRKLGYRLDRFEAHEPEAPGEQGRRMIWVWDCGGAANASR
jgi:RimJ/RimL family protein N-acetyltransferase